MILGHLDAAAASFFYSFNTKNGAKVKSKSTRCSWQRPRLGRGRGFRTLKLSSARWRFGTTPRSRCREVKAVSRAAGPAAAAARGWSPAPAPEDNAREHTQTRGDCFWAPLAQRGWLQLGVLLRHEGSRAKPRSPFA